MASGNGCDGSSLTGQSKQIILLKASKGPEDPYSKTLASAGFESINFLPVLDYEFVNRAELCSDLESTARFSGIVFTSQTAVEACVRSLSQGDGSSMAEDWETLPVFVVGKATAKAAERLGLKSTGSFSGNAELLSKAIVEYFKAGGIPSRPLLFPCGNLRRETLPRAMEEAGIPLKCLVCYNTVPHKDIEQSLRQSVMGTGDVWTVFFSPSGVKFALECVQSTFQSRLKVAAIGETTADSLREAGQTCDAIAQQPNPDSLVTAITQWSADSTRAS